MGKSELRAELIRFCDSIRNYEHEHSIYKDERESSELVDIFLAMPDYSLDQKEDDSHSPTEPTSAKNAQVQFDTLQEGDWFIGTEEEYREVLDIYGCNPDNPWLRKMIKYGFCVYTENDNALGWAEELKTTQLTAPEFIRRAENTFKTK